MKTCTKCGETKKLVEFHNDRTNRDGKKSACKVCAREKTRKWREANPEKAREKDRKWSEANPEKNREKTRKWSEANPEKNREKTRKWREANPEKARESERKWREANPEKHREKARKWREANPEKNRAARLRRRAREAGALGFHTAEELAQRIKEFYGSCVYCGDPYEHVDHIWPLADGGSNYIENLAPACASCNLSKNAKAPIEWCEERGIMTDELRQTIEEARL